MSRNGVQKHHGFPLQIDAFWAKWPEKWPANTTAVMVFNTRFRDIEKVSFAMWKLTFSKPRNGVQEPLQFACESHITDWFSRKTSISLACSL